MEKVDFIPLGSIVIMKGNLKKLMIIGRGLITTIEGEQKFFDYAACTYPEGIIGDSLVYFNGDVIQEIVQEGYVDKDDTRMVAIIQEQMVALNIEKGDPQIYGQSKES